MDQGRACMSYARALLDWAEESNLAKEVYYESSCLIKCINDDPSFYQLLHSPMVSLTKKTKTVTVILKGCAPRLTNLVALVVKNRREKLLKHILQCYQKLFRDKYGIIKTSVEVASEINQKTQQAIIEFVAGTFNKSVEIEFLVNPIIIGGFKITIEDRQLDKSIKGELEELRKQLL